MIRIGHGFDVHRLTSERKMVLGGVTIPYEKGLLGHSDADVLTHAICDAILGALAAGDIGHHFPDNDPSYKGIESLRLLETVMTLCRERGYRLGNLDATIIAQRPKLAPHLPSMAENIARCCAAQDGSVNLKATTTEELGFEGRGEGISAHAVVLLCRMT